MDVSTKAHKSMCGPGFLFDWLLAAAWGGDTYFSAFCICPWLKFKTIFLFRITNCAKFHFLFHSISCHFSFYLLKGAWWKQAGKVCLLHLHKSLFYEQIYSYILKYAVIRFFWASFPFRASNLHLVFQWILLSCVLYRGIIRISEVHLNRGCTKCNVFNA